MTESRFLGVLSKSMQGDKITFSIFAIVVIAMMIDISLARVYDLINKQPTSNWRVLLFASTASISIAGQLFILGYVAKASVQLREVAKLRIRTIHNAARIVQYMIISALAILVIQTSFAHQYSTLLLIAILCISYGLSVIILGLLAQRFFGWYRSNRNPSILLYALASASISISACFTMLFVTDILADRPSEMGPYSAGSMVLIPKNSLTSFFNSSFFISSIISFSLLWIATASLLRHYSAKVGAIKYWLIVGSPLILFAAQFASYFGHVFDSLFGSDPLIITLWVTLIFTLSKPIGGLLFAIAFYSIARRFKRGVSIRNYLTISAFGFVLLFVADEASVLLVAPFPAYGVPSISFLGIASYLILLGIYSSAISISEDVKLRLIVRETTLDQTKLLDSLGTAHLKENIEKRVLHIIKENSDKIREETGLEPLVSEENVKSYIDEVMKELQVKKSRNSNRS